MNPSKSLPDEGYVRLSTIIGDRRSGQQGLIPVGATTWWNGVKAGRFPKPVKLGPHITAWRVEDIRRLVEELANVGR